MISDALRSLAGQVEALTAELNNVGLPKLARCPACTEELPMLQCDQLTQDAKRYRWLRNRMPGQAYRVAGIIYGEISEVDKQIDAAIAKGTA